MAKKKQHTVQNFYLDNFVNLKVNLYVCLDSALDDTVKINILRQKFSESNLR